MAKSNTDLSLNFDLDIVKAQKNQLSIIKELAKEIWPITFKNILTKNQIDYMLSWMYSISKLEENFDIGDEFYLLKLNKNFAGYIHLEKLSGEKTKIQKIYLLPKFHKQGIGKWMLNYVINLLKEKNTSLIELQVNRTNTAVKFYLNFGFQIIESKDFDIGGGYYMNDYIMQYRIKN